MIDAAQIVKECMMCRLKKPLSDFYVRRRITGVRPSRGAFGRVARCKPCQAEKRKPSIHAERQEKADLVAKGLKRCGKCKAIFPLETFHIRKASNDGRAYKCPECVKAALRDWRKENPDGFSRWHNANREHRSEYYRRWREANPDHVVQRIADWAKANRDKVNAKNAKRIAQKFNATVAWADQDAIRAIYAEAARLTSETGIRHEVDHYYPLQGELVCGLHCEANLQILTKAENIRKKNRMPVEVAA